MDIDKLREDLLKKNDTESKDEFLREVELKRKNREEAKLKIIRKINQDVVPLDMNKSIKLEPIKNREQQLNIQAATPPLKIIKSKQKKELNKSFNIQAEKEKLSYTLQLNKVNQNQIANYRKRKINSEISIINYKLNTLNPQLTKLYITIVLILIILITLISFMI